MQIGSVQQGSLGLAYPASLGAVNPMAVDATYYDPRDTNRDGIISAVEARAYALTHPQALASAGAVSSASALRSKASIQGYLDPKDLNRDGSVSLVEENTYALAHPQASTPRVTEPSSAEKTSSVAYDPRDTDQDGIVSPAEDYLYALEHPYLASQKPGEGGEGSQVRVTGYNAQGMLSSSAASLESSLDIYA